jgi:hypothetical protein
LDAEGLRILDFAQAQEKARSWFLSATTLATGEHVSRRGYTVDQCCQDYLLWCAKIAFGGFERNVTLLHCVGFLRNHGRNDNSPETSAIPGTNACRSYDRDEEAAYFI